MLATEILNAEHRVIEQAVNCLEKLLQQSRTQGKLDGHAARDLIAFFRNFVEHCHHAKEENLLLPAMDVKGIPLVGGPTEIIFCEHETMRTHVRGMHESVAAAAKGDSTALKQFVRHGCAYIDLLREHIEKEDHCLFEVANQAFARVDQEALLEAFEYFEPDKVTVGTHEKYCRLAQDLADRLQVPHTIETAAAVCGHGCRH